MQNLVPSVSALCCLLPEPEYLLVEPEYVLVVEVKPNSLLQVVEHNTRAALYGSCTLSCSVFFPCKHIASTICHLLAAI